RPGRLLECTFAPGTGLEGTHTFVVERLGDDACRLRHEIRARARGTGRILWPVAVRWLHDALIEDLFDRVERRLGTGPARPARWSPWVRVLRRAVERPVVRAVAVPADGLLPAALDRVDASDAFAVDVADGTSTDPQWWADRLFRDPPAPVVALMAVREAVVGLVGIERTSGDEFATRERTAEEVLLGADAGHLNFRAVVRREPGRVVLATAVALRNGRGRLYWTVVSRVHPIVVRAMLARAVARAGAPDRRESSSAPGPGSAILPS
ncbi:MAG: DUF2867 domain-containing protein, partial [Pseudonocardia sediminis]